MESQKPKIVLYAKRSFGEKLNVSFDFIKENWKVILKYTTYFILPICLIQAVHFGSFSSEVYKQQALAEIANNDYVGAGITMALNASLLVFTSIIAGVIMFALIMTLFRTYMDREDRLNNLRFSEIKSLFIRNIKRSFIFVLWYFLFLILFSILVVVFGMITWYTLIIIFPLFIVLLIPLMLTPPVYLLEDISIWKALKKSYHLGFATYGGICLMMLIMFIIANVIQTVLAIPWYVTYMVRMIFSISDGGTEATVSVGYSFLQYLLFVILLFGSYISSIFYCVGLSFQYGHASEKVESITIENDIDNFDKL